jgi:hypothetical protein
MARTGQTQAGRRRIAGWPQQRMQQAKKTRSRGAGKSILWEGGGDRENYTGREAPPEIPISNIQYPCGE